MASEPTGADRDGNALRIGDRVSVHKWVSGEVVGFNDYGEPLVALDHHRESDAFDSSQIVKEARP